MIVFTHTEASAVIDRMGASVASARHPHVDRRSSLESSSEVGSVIRLPNMIFRSKCANIFLAFEHRCIRNRDGIWWENFVTNLVGLNL